ncbi:MAG: hypothetical protein QOJ65_1106 [Fimbriimonadaceae bacterium]|nr:hypothetical protein [Fimbriimonadaceae bacterium]
MDSVTETLELYPKVLFACRTREYRDERKRQKLTSHQLNVLGHLHADDPKPVLQLAKHLGVKPATASLSLDRLERSGYIRRQRSSKDARVVHVLLTPDGERMKQANSVLDPDRVLDLLSQLDASQLRTAIEGLRVLAEAADKTMAEKSASTASENTTR